MTVEKRRIYWDTCIFLAWIKGEKRTPGQLAGAEAVADEVFKNTLTLMTSVITKAEICYIHQLNPGQMDKLNKIFGRRNVQQIDVTERVATKAGELRQHYRKTAKSPALGFADAIHLATAILYKAEAFHTFDGMRGPVTTKTKDEFLTLLPLNGDVAGYPLKIELPQSDQTTMELRPEG